jgi:hypothetical protein
MSACGATGCCRGKQPVTLNRTRAIRIVVHLHQATSGEEALYREEPVIMQIL